MGVEVTAGIQCGGNALLLQAAQERFGEFRLEDRLASGERSHLHRIFRNRRDP